MQGLQDEYEEHLRMKQKERAEEVPWWKIIVVVLFGVVCICGLVGVVFYRIDIIKERKMQMPDDEWMAIVAKDRNQINKGKQIKYKFAAREVFFNGHQPPEKQQGKGKEEEDRKEMLNEITDIERNKKQMQKAKREEEIKKREDSLKEMILKQQKQLKKKKQAEKKQDNKQESIQKTQRVSPSTPKTQNTNGVTINPSQTAKPPSKSLNVDNDEIQLQIKNRNKHLYGLSHKMRLTFTSISDQNVNQFSNINYKVFLDAVDRLRITPRHHKMVYGDEDEDGVGVGDGGGVEGATKSPPQQYDQEKDEVEVLSAFNLQQSYYEGKYLMSKHIERKMCVVIPTFNNALLHMYLYNIESVMSQQYSNIKIVIMDDASTDSTPQLIQQYLKKFTTNDKFKVVTLLQNEQHVGKLQTIYNTVNKGCSNDDIVVLLDGYGYLIGRYALKVVNAAYSLNGAKVLYSNSLRLRYIRKRQRQRQRKDVELTTNYQLEGISLGFAMQYPADIRKNSFYRQYTPCFGHLITFQAALFKDIAVEDFIMQENQWYGAQLDMMGMSASSPILGAMLFPMMEMACGAVYYLPEILVATVDINEQATDLQMVKQNIEHIRARKRYHCKKGQRGEYSLQSFKKDVKDDDSIATIIDEGEMLQKVKSVRKERGKKYAWALKDFKDRWAELVEDQQITAQSSILTSHFIRSIQYLYISTMDTSNTVKQLQSLVDSQLKYMRQIYKMPQKINEKPICMILPLPSATEPYQIYILLESIKNQKYSNYKLFVVARQSIAKYVNTAINNLNLSKYTKVITTEHIHSYTESIYFVLHEHCTKQQIVVPLQSTDQLISPFSLVYHSYSHQKGHGFVYSASIKQFEGRLDVGASQTLGLQFADDGNYRKQQQLVFGRLRSYKNELLLMIKIQDLQDGNNDWVAFKGDTAFMYPALELSCGKVDFIAQITTREVGQDVEDGQMTQQQKDIIFIKRKQQYKCPSS